MEESKALVRKKLHLPSTAMIQLEQIRDGKLIDLEDGRLVINLYSRDLLIAYAQMTISQHSEHEPTMYSLSKSK